MIYDWKFELRPSSRTAAAHLPPATIDETAWDILLALHSDERCELGLDKLGRLASVSETALDHWLGVLEERQLIAGARPGFHQQLRAVLTPAGRNLLDRYLSASSALQTACSA